MKTNDAEQAEQCETHNELGKPLDEIESILAPHPLSGSCGLVNIDRDAALAKPTWGEGSKR